MILLLWYPIALVLLWINTETIGFYYSSFLNCACIYITLSCLLIQCHVLPSLCFIIWCLLLSLNPLINKHLLLSMADSVFQCHVNLFVNFLSLLSFFSFNLITHSLSLFDTPFNCTYLLISFGPILFMSLFMVQVAFCH